MASEDRFGFEWRRYSKICPDYELQFTQWVHPLRPEDFKGKKVLDAGCGIGRNSYWSIKWGAREVVAFDFDQRSVSEAKNNLSQFPNARVEFSSIYDIRWDNEFDLVFSIGVMHHLKKPKVAIVNLAKSLKSQGKLLIWVYSYEGNEWIVRFIDPIRKRITSKLPVGLVHSLSYFFSVPLWVFVKLFNGPTLYLKQLSKFEFWHIHSIVFDQLIPEVVNYWKKDEVLELFKDIDFLKIEAYRPLNNCGWTIRGIKK